jgi:histidine ammonia-lyase
MGVSAARKARQILQNTRNVLAMELLCAAQGLDFLQPLKAGHGAQAAFEEIRKIVSTASVDRAFHKDIEAIYELILQRKITARVESAVGSLH